MVAVLAANLVFCVASIVWMREDLKRERIDKETTLVATKIQDVLWGKITLFASVVRGDGEPPNGLGRISGGMQPSIVAGDLPAEWNFQRLRMGGGDSRRIFLGTPRETSNHEYALPLAELLPDRLGGKRYFVGTVSIGELAGYFKDLKRRGILCFLTDEKGNLLLGDSNEAMRKAAFSPAGKAHVFAEALANGWSAEVYLEKADVGIAFFPQAVVAIFFVFSTSMLVLLRYRYIRPLKVGFEKISDSLAAHGEMLPGRMQPHYVAGAVTSRLSRYKLEVEEERRKVEEDSARRSREMSQKYTDLLAHHRITKKMLQSRQYNEVFDTLRDGIAEGNGFQGTLIGKVSKDGYLLFQEELDPATGIPLRVPLWKPGFLLARIFWSGNNVFHPSPLDLPHMREEEDLVGSGPAYFIPLMRDIQVRCAEVKNCGDRSCPNFFSNNMKCWLHHLSSDQFLPDVDPEFFREPLLACLNCEVFPGAALAIVRSLPEGKAVSRENILPLSSLASEAALALEVVNLHESMKIMAITDGLTGLFNHREFYQALRRELVRARRYRHAISLLIIDVDDFKQYNDRFGHPAGDQALQHISEILRKCARTTDVIARYGGEEFSIILPESSPAGALMVAERIKTEIASFNFIQDITLDIKLTVSIGIYTSDGGGVTEDQMVSYADEAAYTAKKSGKNRVVVKAPS